MNLPQQTAKHLRDVHFGGNWTFVNLKDTLAGVNWEIAITKVYSFNTIATLVYHVNYYVDTIKKVLQQQPLDAHDKFSFDCPPITNEDDWQKLLTKVWDDAETLAGLIEQLPEPVFWEVFTNEKYGNYCRNFMGLIEHTHYHLGQITLIKKIIESKIAGL